MIVDIEALVSDAKARRQDRTTPDDPVRPAGRLCPAVIRRSQQRRRFGQAGPPLTLPYPELFAVLPHDRGGRFEADAYGAALVDKGALAAMRLTTSSGVNIEGILLPP